MSHPKYRKVPLRDLFVDERYQRELRPRRVKSIVAHYDPRQLGVLEVSERNGAFAVFDGQHRLEALRAMDIASAPCLVHSKLTPEDEAHLFVRLQDDRKGPSGIERFKAKVFSGDEQATEIEHIITEAGYRVLNSGDAGELGIIRAIAALERIYKREGPDLLRQTLDTTRDLWFGDVRHTDGYLLEGLAQFLRGYGNRFGPDEADRLRVVAPTQILRRALGSMQGGGSHARFAVDAELRKVAGVRGKPVTKPKLKLVEAA